MAESEDVCERCCDPSECDVAGPYGRLVFRHRREIAQALCQARERRTYFSLAPELSTRWVGLSRQMQGLRCRCERNRPKCLGDAAGQHATPHLSLLDNILESAIASNESDDHTTDRSIGGALTIVDYEADPEPTIARAPTIVDHGSDPEPTSQSAVILPLIYFRTAVKTCAEKLDVIALPRQLAALAMLVLDADQHLDEKDRFLEWARGTPAVRFTGGAQGSESHACTRQSEAAYYDGLWSSFVWAGNPSFGAALQEASRLDSFSIDIGRPEYLWHLHSRWEDDLEPVTWSAAYEMLKAHDPRPDSPAVQSATNWGCTDISGITDMPATPEAEMVGAMFYTAFRSRFGETLQAHTRPAEDYWGSITAASEQIFSKAPYWFPLSVCLGILMSDEDLP